MADVKDDPLMYRRLIVERNLEDGLTPREAEVMDLVVEGCTSQAIALRLHQETQLFIACQLEISLVPLSAM